MKIKLSFVLVFILASLSINAQSSLRKSSSPKSEIKLEKTIISSGHSDYAEMEKKIIKAVKGNVIPASVPKYVKGQTLESYKALLRKWANKNKSLLTDKYLAKLNTKKSK